VKLLICLKGCGRMVRRNEDVRKELGILSLNHKIRRELREI
jgi:hypothetical protein